MHEDSGESEFRLLKKHSRNSLPRCSVKNGIFNKYKAFIVVCFMLVSSFAYSSALKIQGTCCSQTSVDFQLSTQHCVPEDRMLQDKRSEVTPALN
jgi:hypothetical protein